MRFLLATVAAVLLLYAPTLACDDHHGKCELEAWRGYKTGPYVTIEGSATCDTGHMIVRLYDGDKFLAMADGYVEGHAVKR